MKGEMEPEPKVLLQEASENVEAGARSAAAGAVGVAEADKGECFTDKRCPQTAF